MSDLYPPCEPYDYGFASVGDGQQVYWETCGNPSGKPVLVLHGGPGSGCTAGWRRYFDPTRYRIVLFDQRGCGCSRPHASDPTVSLAENTTWHLVRDMEMLRTQLKIDQWMLLAGSWGVTLGLAYTQAHPDRVTEAVLFSITTTSAAEVEWVTRGAGRFFPEAWARFQKVLPLALQAGNLAVAYSQQLAHTDAQVREEAALEWCKWETALVALEPEADLSPRYRDAGFRMAFARLVTHYWAHCGWLAPGALIAGAAHLAGIPAILIHGRLDLSTPPGIAWDLAQHWPGAQLVILEGVGHGAGTSAMDDAILQATDRFAAESNRAAGTNSGKQEF